LAEISFGEWLKRRRGVEGWTQKEVAGRIHCSVSALRKYESEERRPSTEMVRQFADLFDIPEEERKSFLCFARGDWVAFAGGDMPELPWRSLKTERQSNLPSLFTSFIGRENEQREVINLLKQNRLVTLAGAGGMGKTRLAIQVGHQLLQDYPDGVWFVPLDSFSNPSRIPQTVASAFGIRESVDAQVSETLKRFLQRKNILLILDNCEHLLDACAQLILLLLTHCPKLSILTTSREILKMEGEAVYYLPPLSSPEESASLEIMDQYESVQLFVERAALTHSSFQLTEENVRTITNICRRVDGIPLAIELIAARLNILKVDEILNQLQESFAVLANNRRTTLSRHQSLQASIDWSWSLLSDPEQVFLRQLSIFTGGWTLESAQAVCDGNALDLTNALAQKSLIIVEQELEHQTRYHFHDILRQYTYEKLVESGEEETVRIRHLAYFLKLSEQIEFGLRGNQHWKWTVRAIDEGDNLRAALEQAYKIDIEAGLNIASRLQVVWERYDVREGLYWLSKFLQDPESKQYPYARARALCAQGWLLVWSQQFQQSCLVAEQALSLFQTCNDRPGEIDALLLLAVTNSHTEDQDEGTKRYQQALALAQLIGDIWRQAKIYSLMGWHKPDYQRSLAYFKKSVALFREAGDQRSLADSLNSISNLVLGNAEIELAQKYLDEAKLLFPMDEIDIWTQFLTEGIISLAQGDYEQAHTFLQEALVNAEKLGSRHDYLWAQVYLGYLALRRGNHHKARELFAETAQVFQKKHFTIGVVFALEGIADLFTAMNNPETAARLIGWADATRDVIEDPRPLLEQANVDKVIDACISMMGEAAFSHAYDQGQTITMDEAVALALSE
jgi:predicted ATPase/DNA-binding XRE family transcriptional regulator